MRALPPSILIMGYYEKFHKLRVMFAIIQY